MLQHIFPFLLPSDVKCTVVLDSRAEISLQKVGVVCWSVVFYTLGLDGPDGHVINSLGLMQRTMHAKHKVFPKIKCRPTLSIYPFCPYHHFNCMWLVTTLPPLVHNEIIVIPSYCRTFNEVFVVSLYHCRESLD